MVMNVAHGKKCMKEVGVGVKNQHLSIKIKQTDRSTDRQTVSPKECTVSTFLVHYCQISYKITYLIFR